MIRRILLAAAVAALPAASLAASPRAGGAGACEAGAYADVTRELAGRYGEAPVARAWVLSNHIIEIWASAATGTWKILILLEDGTVCVGNSGLGWTPAPVGDPT